MSLSKNSILFSLAALLLLFCLFSFFQSRLKDERVEYALHSMPSGTNILTVVNASNIVFDQQIIQFPEAETLLQLLTLGSLRNLKDAIRPKDVLLSVRAVVDNEFTNSRCSCPSASFLFFSSDVSRDKEVDVSLNTTGGSSSFSDEGKTVYKFADGQYLCRPRSGLVVGTDDKMLMHTILARLDSWWLIKVALPANLVEWNYVNQSAPYWGVRHFASGDDTSPTNRQDARAIGMTFQFANSSTGFSTDYISRRSENKSAGMELFKEIGARGAHCLTVQIVDPLVTRLKIQNPFFFSTAAYAMTEWFDPPMSIRVDDIRQHLRKHRFNSRRT